MERKKTRTLELDHYEREILELLVHAESYENLYDEFSASSYILGDCLRSLIRQKLVFIFEWEESTSSWKKRIIYDADKLKEYRFQLSALG
ncbi:MAG: hypothetical protein ACYC1Q_02430, partial [Bacteroidia bacterium]